MKAHCRNLLIGFVVVAAALGGVTAPGMAQDASLGIKIGVSSVRGRRGELLSAGFVEPTVTSFARFGLGRIFAIQPEVSLAAKGVRWERTVPSKSVDQSVLTYLEVPVMLTLSPLGRGRRWNPYVVAGPVTSVLLSCVQTFEVQLAGNTEFAGVSDSCDAPDSSGRPRYVTNRFELGVQIGMGVELAVAAGRLLMEARHTRGLTSMQPGAEPSVLNRRVSGLVGFSWPLR